MLKESSAPEPPDLQADPEAASSSHIEEEMVNLFANLARSLGNPPSYGAIYGLLFFSPEPLSMEEIIDRLKISKGSASQGLRRLVDLGALRRIKSDRQRQARFVAELEMRRVLGSFLSSHITPRLEYGTGRLQAMARLAEALPDASKRHTSERLSKLTSWYRRAGTALPLVLQLIQDD